MTHDKKLALRNVCVIMALLMLGTWILVTSYGFCIPVMIITAFMALACTQAISYLNAGLDLDTEFDFLYGSVDTLITYTSHIVEINPVVFIQQLEELATQHEISTEYVAWMLLYDKGLTTSY